METESWLPIITGIVAAMLGTAWLWASSRSTLFAFQSEEITRSRARMDLMQAEIDDLRDLDRRREEELLELRLDLMEVHRGVEVLLEQLSEQAIAPRWTPKGKKPRKGGVRDTLAHRLEEQFNIEELDSLAHDLGIVSDQLAGETISARALALVELSYRRGSLVELEAAVNHLRPQPKGTR